MKTVFCLLFRYYEDDSLTAPLNWIYDSGGRKSEIKYLFFDTLTRYHQRPVYVADQSITKVFRAVEFNGSPSQVLVIPQSLLVCERILDPEYDADLYQ